MVTLNDLSNIIDNNVLHELYLARDLTLADITENDKMNLKEIQDKEKRDYETLVSAITDMREIDTIKNLIEQYVDSNAQISAYFDEKLYKTRSY